MDTQRMAPADVACNHDAFLVRFLAIQPTLRSYVATLVAGAADIDDVMQEVSIALMDSFPRYDASLPFIAWALGVARNHAARWQWRRSCDARRFSAGAQAALAVAYEDLQRDTEPPRGAARVHRAA